MGIDIGYLLFLQNLRNATGGVFDEFFNAISKVAVSTMELLPFLVFWGISTYWGYRFFAGRWVGEVVNGLVKLTVCAYRPWIRSPEVEPAGDSKVAATGYSFPSGHTMCATVFYGTTAVWQYKKRRWLAIVCGVMILLTGFSRNFLGVHTPQDVAVGFVETALIVILVGKVMNWMREDEKRADIMTVVAIVGGIIALIYIKVKPYPMDYVDGKLLVDPVAMMKDCFSGVGGLFGLAIGSYVERHYVHYRIPYRSRDLTAVVGAGLILVGAWKEYISGATIVLLFGKNWGGLISSFILVFFAIAIYPMIIMKVGGKPEEKPAQKSIKSGKRSGSGTKKKARAAG